MALNFPDDFPNVKLPFTKTTLIFGPSGSGKKYLAKSLANLCHSTPYFMLNSERLMKLIPDSWSF